MLRVDLHLHSYFSHDGQTSETDEYADVRDFLDKLRCARHVVTAASGTGRRA